MFEKAKLLSVAIAAVIIFLGFLTNIIGRKYDTSKDFSCCKGDQLVVQHYYKMRIFFITISSGYSVEPIGKPTPGGCNIQCAEH